MSGHEVTGGDLISALSGILADIESRESTNRESSRAVYLADLNLQLKEDLPSAVSEAAQWLADQAAVAPDSPAVQSVKSAVRSVLSRNSPRLLAVWCDFELALANGETESIDSARSRIDRQLAKRRQTFATSIVPAPTRKENPLADVIPLQSAARILRKTTRTIHGMVKRGDLRGFFGGATKTRITGIYRDSLTAYQNSQRSSF